MKIFKVLKDYPNYEVFEDGTVWRKEHKSFNGYKLKRTKITPYVCKNGYIVVCLHDTNGKRKSFYLHRLVWETFNGEIPKGMEISHEDCDRSNCKLENLRLRSHSSNCRNPMSLEHYREANSLDKGKFNRERMVSAKGKENKNRLKKEYLLLWLNNGHIGVWQFMKESHCNYYTALKIMGEMKEITEKMGVS